MTRVIDGGRTRSLIASAPGVIGPQLDNVASADSCDNDTGDAGGETATAGKAASPPTRGRWPTRYRSRSQREGYDRTRIVRHESPNGSPAMLIAHLLPRRTAAGISPAMLMQCPPTCKSLDTAAAARALLDPWPVIAVGALAWLLAAVAAFVVPALVTWRPMTLAGLAVGVLGTSIFLWQRDAAAGARAAPKRG